MVRGKNIVLFVAISFTCSHLYAQNIELPNQPSNVGLKQKLKHLTDDPSHNGYFGFQLGSKVNQYRSIPSEAPLRRMDFTSTQNSLTRVQCTLQDLKIKTPFANGLTLPDFQKWMPVVSMDQFEQIINKKAIQSFINQQVHQFGMLEQTWAPHISAIETMIHQNFNSIVDIPSLSQQIFAYIENNHLLNQFQNDCTFIQNIDWSSISLESFINQDELQLLFDQFSDSYQLANLSASTFINQTSHAMDVSFHDSLTQTVSSLYDHGFRIQDNTLYFYNPDSPKDGFSFSADLSGSDASLQFSENSNGLQGSFVANAGNYITVHGGLNLDTDGLAQNLEAEALTSFNQLLFIVQQGIQEQISLDQLLENMQNAINGISSEALPTVLQHLEENLDSDFSLSLNLQALSDSFTGAGSYQFIDIILETLGHDVGSVTLNKQQILDIAQMISKGGNESDIGKYIMEDVAGYKVEIVGYNVARDITNTYLTEHFTGNIIALQHSISGPGGLIFNGSTYYGSAKLFEWNGGRLAATGSYNHHSFNNSPLLKKDGYLHLRTELQSNSLGIAYIPKILDYQQTKTRVDGIVQIEGLFIHAKSASILTKTALTTPGSEDVVELYRVPLGEIDGATKTYTVPMLSVGLNLQQTVAHGVCVNGYAVCYPGFKQNGNLNEITRAIAPRVMTGFSLIFNLPEQKKRMASPTPLR